MDSPTTALGNSGYQSDGDRLLVKISDRPGRADPLGQQLIQVVGLGGGELPHREVDDEQLDGGQAAVFVVQGVVQAGGGEAFEALVGAGHVDGAAAADGDVAQRGAQVSFPDADGYPRFRLEVAAFLQVMSLLRLM